jgi:rfaE bifunctional protein kinase chain/domain
MLKDQITRLAEPRVLVVGDVFLDEYLFGTPTRLSREAPIPVLELDRRSCIPGGAANPAHNVAALGAKATLAAVVGDDAEGRQLVELLRAAGVDPGCVITDPTRPTTVKTRVVTEGSLRFPQQIARIDRISRAAIHPRVVASLGALIGSCADQVDAILCSDYLSGLLTHDMVRIIRDICREHDLLFTVDAQGELDKYRGATLLRCNNYEAESYLGKRLESEDDFGAGLARMVGELDVALAIVTRGADGLSLAGREVPYRHLPVYRVEVADVTGAGDTFISVTTLALAAGLAPEAAAALANTAAALVVRRVGNAVVTPDELEAAASGQDLPGLHT